MGGRRSFGWPSYTFLIARRVSGNPLVAVGVAALVAVMPELMLDVCRIGNDCLGIGLFSWLTLLCLDLSGTENPRRIGIRIGVALGFGLLTKAYFLTALPAVAKGYVWQRQSEAGGTYATM